MAVYIKGMELPRTGQVYTFEVVKRGEVPYMRIRVGFEVVAGVCGINLEEKWEEYPLVEIKAPHGRLIDADALMDKEKWWDNDYAPNGFDCIVEVDDIKNAPTVLEAEGKDDV